MTYLLLAILCAVHALGFLSMLMWMPDNKNLKIWLSILFWEFTVAHLFTWVWFFAEDETDE